MQVLTYNLEDGKAVLWSTGFGKAFILVSANQNAVKTGQRLHWQHQRVKLITIVTNREGAEAPYWELWVFSLLLFLLRQKQMLQMQLLPVTTTADVQERS